MESIKTLKLEMVDNDIIAHSTKMADETSSSGQIWSKMPFNTQA
jgi:hypothetical protein